MKPLMFDWPNWLDHELGASRREEFFFNFPLGEAW
jgi:hypothetical protein